MGQLQPADGLQDVVGRAVRRVLLQPQVADPVRLAGVADLLAAQPDLLPAAEDRRVRLLDAQGELYVGLFGANTQSEVRKTLMFKNFQATVWTVAAPDLP